jgi:protein-S-isoprenylcysteine O-methyltransferase Ste14
MMKMNQRKILWLTVIEFLEMITAAVAIVFTDATGKSLVLGGAIALAGASLFTWAGGFPRMEREGLLTLGGPYKFVRHPWILARFLMVFGVILMARLPWLFLFAMVGLGPMYRRMTRKEDQWLYAQLGPVAAEYRAFVSGFIPQFLPAKLPVSGKSTFADSFSWRRAFWLRPVRGGLVLLGVVGTILGMALWTEHWVPLWAWRAGSFLVTGLAVVWMSRDHARWQSAR